MVVALLEVKHKPEIVEMANYYASRGWVYVSIDYRTAEELGDIDDMSVKKLLVLSRLLLKNGSNILLKVLKNLRRFNTVAMYAAQRDSKAALRWLVANAATYEIDVDQIAVGGASAGAHNDRTGNFRAGRFPRRNLSSR